MANTTKTSETKKKSSSTTAKSSSGKVKSTAQGEKKSSAASKPASKSNFSASGSKKAKKPSKVWIVILVVLAILAIACYFFKPDWFNAGKEIVLDLLESQKTEQTAEPKTNESVAKSATGATDTGKAMTAENLPLYFGNPSGATTEIKNAKNYLMEKVQYSMSYNAEKYIPNWVMWHLAKIDVGEADRSDDFRPDDELPPDFYGVKKADYQYNDFGFDRGHVCPSADRTATKEDNSMTFLMTNMIPQSPNCNRNVWRLLEAYERDLAEKYGKELYIAAGPYGRGGTSDKGTFDEIPLKNGKGSIEVPEYCWKIVMILEEGENDFNRVNADTDIIAAWIPNNQVVSDHTWDYYITTIDFIEEKTGFDFFAALANDVEDVLEAKKFEYKKL